ncbi:zinc finger BED domain-containing protein RICESLEEPER 1-like [Pyrus ussuriensis x Pyrus communis]|uniref:Zinc finger BED domain-containing protein RICESLEEPER 1-like n=1 Tax=Pyrus ussuriensis x Pyrus communis TaxID=2448454 RepID=A0A5N5I908_9ROSA|nr:zinc finger BED domain-containing protein RICESLEEPER 1-like [Pyrus ussuriensis x Pyrus communis]
MDIGESTPPQNTMVAPRQTPSSLGGFENPTDATPKEGDQSDQVSKEEALLESLKSHERSKVWAHFERKIEGGRVKGLCKYCAQSYMADLDKNGTTNLKNHIARCRSYGPNKEIFAANRQKILTFAGTKDKLKAIGFSQEEVTKACVEMIIIDELPFTFVEGEGFRRFCMQACPMWRVPSRKTIAKDVLSLFYSENDKLKSQLKTFRVCLTTDTWTSIQQTNYMVLTTHFIDDDWILHKKILNFCVIPNHKGESIAQLLEECLVEWGIENVLTITVDNASANDSGLRDLVHRISGCVAHILNLVVNDGIKLLNTAIQSIRNAVRYVRSSPQRLESFKRCVEKMMGHYLPYFVKDNHDNMREGPPSMDDWKKYDKYWGSLKDMNQYLFIAFVLDPRHKLDKVVDYFEIQFGEDEEKVESATNGVKDLLIDLYKIHENMSLSTQQSISGGGSSQTTSGDSSSSMTEIERKLKEKNEMRKAKRARVVHNDVDKYLSDPNEGEEEENFDVLNWWRVNGVSKYPILARVAREILAIPVSTIASESSFSTSGRIIDPYRSSLSPKMVEALICTQNWLRSIHVALHHEPTIEEMEFCEEVEKGNFIYCI